MGALRTGGWKLSQNGGVLDPHAMQMGVSHRYKGGRHWCSGGAEKRGCPLNIRPETDGQSRRSHGMYVAQPDIYSGLDAGGAS